MTNLEIAVQYCNQVIQNKILACNLVKLSCKRFLEDLNNSKFFYNAEEVDSVVRFINSLYLTETSEPKHFYLEPWQTFIVCNIYGIWNAERNLRKYQFVYLELPRKNGKSQLINALALYHLIFENDAQVVVSANSKEQAKNIDFKKVKQFCSQIDPKKKFLKQYYNSIHYNHSELIVTASDSTKLDGYNISLACIDELHEAPDSSMYDIFKSSQKSRLSPLLVTITTAGFNVDSFCYQLRDYCISILRGDKQDDSQFVIIYTLDENDNYQDADSIKKANPNLGVSIYEHSIQVEIDKAINNPIEEASIKVKHFNIWLQSKNVIDTYIDSSFIKQSSKPIKIEDYNNLECYVGIDLASTTDITAVSYMIPYNDKLLFFNKYFLPEHSVNTNINRHIYKQWADLGYIFLTSGNVTDYNIILEDIMQVNKTNDIQLCSYDAWNATQFTIQATEEGLNMQPYSQSTYSLNKPTKELSRLIMNDKVVIQSNPVTEFMFNNTVIMEYGENIRPGKNKKHEKIDGVMACIMTLGGYLGMNHYNFDIT